jgi:hypothetical protein
MKSKEVTSSQYFFASGAQRIFVTLHLALPMLQKLLSSVKEWGKYGALFGGRGFNVQ